VPLPQRAGRRDFERVRVALFRGRAEGEPVRTTIAPLVDGSARFGGIEPGRWTLWIDPMRDFAPLVIEDVEIAEGVNELEPARFEAGSSIRVRVKVAEGQAAPRVFLSARSQSSPSYVRSANSGKSGDPVVSGFGAGSFAVSVQSVMGNRVEPRTVELDGRTELVIDFDPNG
jgi:hypothetical protein